MQIIACFDELEICNPLGSRVKRHKLGVVFYTLGNIHPKYRSMLKGACRGSSKKSEKICVARWDYAIHKYLELSYLAFSQNSLSNSPRFASLAYSYFVVYISNHIKMTDKFLPFTRKLHMRSSATVILHANSIKT